MINRRLIRVKVFKVIFSRVGSESDSISAAEKQLLYSCEKTLDLYYFLMALPAALKEVAVQRIETGLKKFQPTPEEANPNYKFVNNSLIELLESDSAIAKYCSKNGLNWNDYPAFVKKLYNSVRESDYYLSYMESGSNSFEEDLKLVSQIFEQELEESEELESILEDANLYWTDDLAYVLNIILSKLSSPSLQSAGIDHPGIFIKEEDKDYALRLLGFSLVKYNDYTALLSQYVINWETDRLALTDIILIVMGITEAIHFSNIPLKVTINEYVELSKFYSTPNSKLFVNGMLDKVLLALKAEGKIEKSGRGLVGSTE